MTVTALYDHLATGATTVARAWAITRIDGQVLGFTDCDLPLTFDGITFAAQAGMTARAVTQTAGLAVDNTEGMGVLTDDRISDADITAGLYDGAVVQAWLVNWRIPTDRALIFKGTMGEIRRTGTAFEAELRGLTEGLNQPQGRVYQKPCAAVLGDMACGVDVSAPGLGADIAVDRIVGRDTFIFRDLDGFAENWFVRGQLHVMTGAGASLIGWIKSDETLGDDRILTLWEPLRADIQSGDHLRLLPGCDKSSTMCRAKFNNIVNFQGFPFIPGDDWITTFPKRGGPHKGEALV
ncbi:MAG: DUF2163 domain-containing protein [Pseudomonadota bacterium]